MGFDFDRTSKDAFGRTTFYKGSKKVGWSSKPIFGNSNIYDNKSHRVGSSSNSGFGKIDYHDNAGNSLGHSTSSLFGTRNHYDASGKFVGSSSDRTFSDIWNSSSTSTVSSPSSISSNFSYEAELAYWRNHPPRIPDYIADLPKEDQEKYVEYNKLSHVAQNLDCFFDDYTLPMVLDLRAKLYKFKDWEWGYADLAIRCCDKRIKELEEIEERKRADRKLVITTSVITLIVIGFILLTASNN